MRQLFPRSFGAKMGVASHLYSKRESKRADSIRFSVSFRIRATRMFRGRRPKSRPSRMRRSRLQGKTQHTVTIDAVMWFKSHLCSHFRGEDARIRLAKLRIQANRQCNKTTSKGGASSTGELFLLRSRLQSPEEGNSEGKRRCSHEDSGGKIDERAKVKRGPHCFCRV